MRVLVTGAAGFLGGRVLQHLGEHEVYALGRSRRPDGVRSAGWVEQDLTLPLDMARMPGAIDAVIHLAQSRNFRRFPEQAADIFGVNTAATARLLEYARGAGARIFIYASSGGVYAGADAPLNEAAPLVPGNFYAASKAAAELLVHAYAAQLTTVVLRYFFIYGPGQRDMLVPSMVARLEAGQEVTLQGDDGLRINPIFVDDAAAATVSALALRERDTLNVAGPHTLSMRALATQIGKLLGKPPRFASQSGSPTHLVADITRLRERLGVTPRVTPEQGLGEVVGEFARLGRHW